MSTINWYDWFPMINTMLFMGTLTLLFVLNLRLREHATRLRKDLDDRIDVVSARLTSLERFIRKTMKLTNTPRVDDSEYPER